MNSKYTYDDVVTLGKIERLISDSTSAMLCYDEEDMDENAKDIKRLTNLAYKELHKFLLRNGLLEDEIEDSIDRPGN